ncbi:MAG: hypothetical protein R2695_21485 [Acidimicrobiales bacterium]
MGSRIRVVDGADDRGIDPGQPVEVLRRKGVEAVVDELDVGPPDVDGVDRPGDVERLAAVTTGTDQPETRTHRSEPTVTGGAARIVGCRQLPFLRPRSSRSRFVPGWRGRGRNDCRVTSRGSVIRSGHERSLRPFTWARPVRPGRTSTR